MSGVRAVLRTASFVAYSTGFLAVYEARRAVTPASKRPALLDWGRATLSDSLLDILGAELSVEGRSHLSGPALVVSNHQSALDIGVMLALPEGGTFAGDSVHPFQPGTFAAVASLEIPIIPVGLAYSPDVPYGSESFGRHLVNLASRERTRIAVHVGEPLPPGLGSRAAAGLARDRVQALVLGARRALDGAKAP